MSIGITFTDYNEALEYARVKYNEGINATIKKEGSIYKVYLTGKIKSKEAYIPDILKNIGLEEKTIEPNKYFHLTEKALGSSAILKKSRSHSPVEYISFPGVSFSPTIEQALYALPYSEEFTEGKILYIYTPTRNKVGFIPIEDDIEESEEVRIPDDVSATLVKMVFVKLKEDGEWEIKEI